jgi:hypothetical protein
MQMGAAWVKMVRMMEMASESRVVEERAIAGNELG